MMLLPRTSLTAPRTSLLLLCVCLLGTGAHIGLRAQPSPPQQSSRLASEDTARGIEFYKQGDVREAIKLLKQVTKQRPSDAVAWQYLGLALKQKGDAKGARKAFEWAINLRIAYLIPGELISPPNKYENLNNAERAMFRQEMARRYQAAVDNVDAYLQLQPKDADFWRAQRDALSFYAANIDKPLSEAMIFQAGDVSKKAIIVSKPTPEYTEEARAHNTRGKIIVRMILAADGTVQQLLVLKSLPDGLTKNALKVAHAIQFKPAIKDGQPVATITTIEYGFEIY